jgi:response regulator RpfG family c-di-GMP phosphodiesterase
MSGARAYFLLRPYEGRWAPSPAFRRCQKSCCRNGNRTWVARTLPILSPSRTRDYRKWEDIDGMWTTLILEDSALYRQSLLRIFEAHFPAMAIFEAETGQKARQTANTEVLDLVLTDIDLPDVCGLDFTREVKRACASTVVVVLTIHDAPEYRLAAQEHGADYFLVKGSTGTADIVALVESVVAQKKKLEDRCDDLVCRMRRDAY